MTSRTRSMIAVGCLLAFSSPLGPRLDAAGERASFHLQKYSDVVLHDLPRAVPQHGARQKLPFRPTDPDAYGRAKNSPLTSGAPPASNLPVPSTVAVTDGGFDGVGFWDAGSLPPDTQIAVGPNHIFEAVNGYIRIWSRLTSPPSAIYNIDLETFFGVGFFTTFTDVISDPRVIYDPVSDRWFISCVTLESLLNVGDWRLAVSKTNDPTGAYTLYAGSFSGTFPDFPSLGLSDDKLVLTGNAFAISTEQFLGSEFVVENKADLVAGLTNPAGAFFGPPQAVDTIQAAQSLSPTSTVFLAAVPSEGQSSRLQLWSIAGVPGVGAGVSVSTRSLTLQTALVVPPNAPQPGSPVAIATNDARLLNFVYRDGSLWMGSTTGCTPDGDTQARSCLHFVQVDAAAQAVAQEITFGEPGVYYYYPAVTLDANDNMVAVFNRSSSTEFASVYASSHNASDATGSFQTPMLIHSGFAVFDPDPYAPRWGDYSGISVDPFSLDRRVWIAGEYARADGGFDWGTWITELSAGAACALPSTPTGLVAAPSDAQVTLSWNASVGAIAYNVRRAPTPGGPYGTVASGVPTAAYTDTGLNNGTTYYYVVSATNGCGESASSVETPATPLGVQPPAAPTKVTAVGSKGKVKVSWSQSVSAGVTQNKIYRSVMNGGPYALIASIGANTSYTDTQVTSGTSYYYVVTAVSAGGESAQSNQASAKAK